MRRATADRLIAEYGSPDALWKRARTNDWFREGEGNGAERYLRGNTCPAIATSNGAAFQLDVAWHGKSMGNRS